MMAVMEIEPEKFRPQYKVHKLCRVGGNRVDRVSGNNQIFFSRSKSNHVYELVRKPI